jgi:hypothetical protein
MKRVTGVSGTAIAAIVGGLILAYAGVKGKTVSQTIKELFTGTVSPTGDPSLAVHPPVLASGDVGVSNTTSGGGHPSLPSDVPKGGTQTDNLIIGRLYATAYGWYPGPNWDALVKLWQHESNWSNTAMNPSSGAYGIAQALPETKYPLAGRSPAAGGSSSSPAQIQWGLSYIQQRYGNPQNAWAHELANNWY